jgi:hypothetical protein
MPGWRAPWCGERLDMAHLLRFALLATLVAAFSAKGTGQLSADCAAKAAASTAPCVYQVDPPNWWVHMPAPMLLLYGRNLKGSQITADGIGVRITRTQFSENGHYAFAWLSDEGSTAQTVTVHVTSPHGSITFPFELQKRKPASAGLKDSPRRILSISS